MAELNPNPTLEADVDIQVEIEKARKQERDKLHANIEKLKTDLAEKVKVCNENYLQISNLQKDLGLKSKEIEGFEEKLAKAKEDGKMELNKELEAVKAELEDYKAKLAKAEKDFADYKVADELKTYISEKVKDIDTEFRELITGGSKDEVDASYEKVKALQDAIKEKYSKKETLPTPKVKQLTPQKVDDMLEKLKGMTLDEYKLARTKNFK